MINLRLSILLAVATLLTLAGPARADTVTDWNRHATDALIVTAGQSPTVSLPHLAMVHGAVYDAVNAIDRRYESYLGAPPAEPWYSKDAAAAAAAYRVLSILLPAQQAQLDARYAASLAGIPPGAARDGGVAVGDAAAATMVAARKGDGRFGPFRFAVGSAPGQWQPAPPAFVNDPFAWIARVRPFLADTPSRFRSGGPNPLTSRRYADEYVEVKAVGSLGSAARTADQTDMARFWAEHAPAMWSRIARDLAAEHRLGTADGGRLYAMLYLTAADAAIACWDDKAHWGFWRPITAIREAAADGTSATEPDPGWLPLINTPPYPDHPSGHGCVSGSIVRTLQDFFGTDSAHFSALSATSGTTRTFTRFSQAIDEIVDARVYSGLHFRTADEHGAEIGREVARYRSERFFHRMHGRSPVERGTIAFDSDRDGGDIDIWTMRPDGTGLRNLTAGSPATDGLSNWRADGRRIAFMSDRVTAANPEADFEISSCAPTARPRSRSRPTRSTTSAPAGRPTAGASSSSATSIRSAARSTSTS